MRGRIASSPAKLDAAVTLYLAGKTAREVAEATGVSRSVLYRELSKRGASREA